VGCALGSLDGASDGSELGDGDGSAVGTGEGSALGLAVGSSGESTWHDHDGLSTRVDPIPHVSHTNTNASAHKRSFHVLPVVALYPKPLVAQSWRACSA